MDTINTPLTKSDLKGLVKEAAKSGTPLIALQSDQNEIMTVEQVAQMLAMNKSSIYNMISQRRISCVKMGRRVYFFKQEIINLLKSNRKKSNAEIEAETEAYLNRPGKQ